MQTIYNRKYSSQCQDCGKQLANRAAKRCGSCSQKGRINPNAKSSEAGRYRAQKLYPLPEHCEQCKAKAIERHHKDENTFNNERSNILFLCHRCHMAEHNNVSKFVRQGSEHRMAKLTKAQVKEIRQRYAAGGITQYQLAVEYNVHQPTIHRIVRNKLWLFKHAFT